MDKVTITSSTQQVTMSINRLPLVETLVTKEREGVYKVKAAPHSVEEADAMLTIRFVANA